MSAVPVQLLRKLLWLVSSTPVTWPQQTDPAVISSGITLELSDEEVLLDEVELLVDELVLDDVELLDGEELDVLLEVELLDGELEL
jgi:hypothetical protein